MIVIVNYGMGNLGSIQNILKKIGYNSIISSDPQDIRDASKLILPGVGAFDNGMKQLNELGLITPLNEKVNQEKTPILGICLGMQLFARKSEEGVLQGLGWVDADVKRFKISKSTDTIKIPHMGWNDLAVTKESRLFKNIASPRFYFVHSYHLDLDKKEEILGKTYYGYEFTSALEKGNIVAVQFHPEKSHKFGMALLQNFIETY